jgi:hypothetical protein
MNVSDYKQTYHKALAELSDLMERREQLEIELEGVDTRIGEVRQGIKAIPTPLGLTCFQKLTLSLLMSV